jgi:predicted RNase H-like HicB family nuclease
VVNEFTAIIEQDNGWYVASSLEIPGANGQGRTKDDALASLSQSIALILEDRREDGLRGVPDDALRETVRVG